MTKAVKVAKTGTIIKPCTCPNDYQDQKYGKGRRVWNYGPKRKTCTSCGAKDHP
jgi:hypothetical protein